LVQLNTLWWSWTISNPLKARLIQALIWLIVTYGSEAWTLNKELTGNIEAFAVVDRGVGDWGSCPGHQGRGAPKRGEQK